MPLLQLFLAVYIVSLPQLPFTSTVGSTSLLSHKGQQCFSQSVIKGKKMKSLWKLREGSKSSLYKVNVWCLRLRRYKIHKSLRCYHFWFVVTAKAKSTEPDLCFIKCLVFGNSEYSTGRGPTLACREDWRAESTMQEWRKKLICLKRSFFFSCLLFISFWFAVTWWSPAYRLIPFCPLFWFIHWEIKSGAQI